jgi:quinol monooxygenase YgiN
VTVPPAPHDYRALRGPTLALAIRTGQEKCLGISGGVAGAPPLERTGDNKVFARSTTIQALASSIDEGVEYIRGSVMPALLRMQGCAGLSLLVDRENGRCIATSSWTSEREMLASEDRIKSMRENASESFGGEVTDIQTWEIALLHRDHRTSGSTCTRVTWLKCDPSMLDRAVDIFRFGVLPECEKMDGFCSASLMLDRETGRCVTATAWDSREAMEASRNSANSLRSSAARDIEAEIVEVAEFDLALAHLRVPEMA